MTSLPQVPPPAKKSFAQQAARASWMAPICVFVINWALTMSIRSGQLDHLHGMGRLLTLALVTLAALLALFGVAMGIVGLAGVRRHGRKGILVPAIVGICLNTAILGLMLLGVLLQMLVRSSRQPM